MVVGSGVRLMVVAVALTACPENEPTSPSGVFFPTAPIVEAYPTALIEGVLELSSGCVFIAAYGDRWLLLWPEGYSARLASGQIEILDDNGDVIGREGERLRVGGGETNPLGVGGTGEAERWASQLTGLDIPERCGDLYWLVSPN